MEKEIIKILCVEDDPITALVIKKFLENKFEFLIVSDSKSCLEAINQTIFQIIIMDVNLGGGDMEGIGIMQQIKKLPNGIPSKIIAATAFSLPDYRQKFLDFGFDEYIAKPFDKEIFLNTIHQLID